MATKEKIIVIDGSSYFFRAFYAIQRLSTSKGFPTNAIYGFIQMLQRVLEQDKPTKLAIAFDTPKPSFRKEIYSDYKANREAPPEDLIVQIPEILKVVDCFGIKRIELPGFEADDVIGTIAKRATKEGYHVEIITGDKDLMQLVNCQVTIYDSMKDKRYDETGVVEKLGVKPEQVVDFLALMGDASDNIPGVTGIGEKTAVELLREFGSLRGIYEAVEKIKQEKRRETLKKEKEIAFLSQKLATVHCDVPLNWAWPDFDYKGPKREALQAFFEQHEFKGLLKKYGMEGAVPLPQNEQKINYTTIKTEAELTALVKKLKGVKGLALDTETTSLKIQNADLVGISLSIESGKAYYLPVGHVDELGSRLIDQLEPEEVKAVLGPVLKDPKVPKIGQNLKYDLQVLKRFGMEVRGIEADTLLESYLLDPDHPHNLDALALRYLDHKNISYDEVSKEGKLNFSEVGIVEATAYSCEDADITLQLHYTLYPDLKKRGLDKLYHEVEVPLVEILADMEFRGVGVDEKRLKKMNEDLAEELSQVESKIHKMAGEVFNVASPKQLSHILFEKLQLPIIRKTKTGISTDESVLFELKEKHEICEVVLKFRELQKLRSTYVEGLLGEIHPRTKRVHTSYNQAVAATGRLSSSHPNLQNIPTGDSSGYDIRSVFIPREGCELMAADYSQVELRLLADLSGDKALCKAFEQDEDVHVYTGQLIFGKEKISPEERKVAKTINFGVVYGQTPFGLSQTLKISPGEAKEFIDAYYKRYAGVRKYFDALLAQAKKTGYVETKLGRKRYFSDLGSQNRMRREMAERAAMNAPLQGSAADLIKLAMVQIFKRLETEGVDTKMILQVHDELVFEVPTKEKKIIEKLVREEMEGAMKLDVPLKVDIGFGKNWREAK